MERLTYLVKWWRPIFVAMSVVIFASTVFFSFQTGALGHKEMTIRSDDSKISFSVDTIIIVEPKQ